jgi:hypothetical protein
VAGQSIHNSKVKGSNLASCAGREEMVKKVYYCFKASLKNSFDLMKKESKMIVQG